LGPRDRRFESSHLDENTMGARAALPVIHCAITEATMRRDGPLVVAVETRLGIFSPSPTIASAWVDQRSPVGGSRHGYRGHFLRVKPLGAALPCQGRPGSVRIRPPAPKTCTLPRIIQRIGVHARPSPYGVEMIQLLPPLCNRVPPCFVIRARRFDFGQGLWQALMIKIAPIAQR
jgi:hypothetical protein